MSLTTTLTPEGIVVRERKPSGERAWRKSPDGGWQYCADHKGPWITENAIYVPGDVLKAVADVMNNHPDIVRVPAGVREDFGDGGVCRYWDHDGCYCVCGPACTCPQPPRSL